VVSTSTLAFLASPAAIAVGPYVVAAAFVCLIVGMVLSDGGGYK
jgi:predicted LPLAT superfamily acyltransferase